MTNIVQRRDRYQVVAYMIVRASLDLAVRRQLLDHNGAHATHARRRRPTRSRARAWTPEELGLFLTAARAQHLDSWAVLRYLEDASPAAEAVSDLLGRETPLMSWINLGEVHYVLRRLHGEDAATETFGICAT